MKLWTNCETGALALDLPKPIHWEWLLLCFCSTISWGLQSSRWMDLWIFMRVSAHWDDLQYLCSCPTSWEPNQQPKPVLQNSQRNLFTWHRRFHYEWWITFPALCILFLKEGTGIKHTNNIQWNAFHLQPTQDSSKQSYVSFSSSKFFRYYLFLEQNVAVTWWTFTFFLPFFSL